MCCSSGAFPKWRQGTWLNKSAITTSSDEKSVHYTSPFLRTRPAIFLQNSPSAACKVRWVCWKQWCTPTWGCGWGGQCGPFYMITVVFEAHRDARNTGWMQKRTSVACDPCQGSSCQGLCPVWFCKALLAVRRHFWVSVLLPTVCVIWVMAEGFHADIVPALLTLVGCFMGIKQNYIWMVWDNGLIQGLTILHPCNWKAL